MCKERNYIPLLISPLIKKEITHKVDTSWVHSRYLIRSACNVASHLLMVWKFDKVSFLQTHLDTSPTWLPTWVGRRNWRLHSCWRFAIVGYVAIHEILDLYFSSSASVIRMRCRIRFSITVSSSNIFLPKKSLLRYSSSIPPKKDWL